MLQVEKKKRKKSGKILILGTTGLLLMAGILIAFVLFQGPDDLPSGTRKGGSLISRNASEIRRIRITRRGTDSWTVVRNEDGLLAMEDGSGWIVDSALGSLLEDALSNLVYEEILTDNAEDYKDRLEEFGLDAPTLVAEAEFADGDGITVRIGDRSRLAEGEFRYMTMDGDPNLYLVAESLLKDLDVEAELLYPVDQPEIQSDRIDRITIRGISGQTVSEWVLQGSVQDTESDSFWLLTSPVTYPADRDQIGNLKKNAANLRFGLYIGESGEEILEKTGLDRPIYEIEIHLASGTAGDVSEEGIYQVQEKPEETLCLQIGGSRNDMTYYCRYRGIIYSISHFSVDTLVKTDPMDTLARYPATVPLDRLAEMDITDSSGRKDRYVLVRESADSSGTEVTGQTVVCLKNGEEIEYRSFEAAYERLLTVKVSGRLPDGWIRKETKTRFSFHMDSGTTHTVELSEFDALHDAVTLDGWTLFYLIKGGMDEMP